MDKFSIDLQRFKAKSLEQLETVARKIAITAYRRIIMRTPVKTGKARGNWQCTIGSPAIGAWGHNAPSGGAPSQRVLAMGGAWAPLSPTAFYLTNNLPYIGRLEHGSSKQAPAGMVAVTIAELGGIAQDAAGGTI